MNSVIYSKIKNLEISIWKQTNVKSIELNVNKGVKIYMKVYQFSSFQLLICGHAIPQIHLVYVVTIYFRPPPFIHFWGFISKGIFNTTVKLLSQVWQLDITPQHNELKLILKEHIFIHFC